MRFFFRHLLFAAILLNPMWVVGHSQTDRATPTSRSDCPARPEQAKMRSYLQPAPAGFVDLAKLIPTICLDIGYHTPNNFTSSPLPGYGAPGAWMLERPAKALSQIQAHLNKDGLGLLVYDAYRPYRATLAMVAWGRRTKKMYLFRQGYISSRSGHNHGHTIDLTLVDRKTGRVLDMGTPWDTLDTRSHTRNAKGVALVNRLRLRKVMMRYGFRPYAKEWWHFSYPISRTRPRDVPYGCFEPRETQWRAPAHWHKPSFKMPRTWTPRACFD